tara:strand:- start:2206 stop:2448 length:243 start_codon:yes stop_codon:yes gene_type:complete
LHRQAAADSIGKKGDDKNQHLPLIGTKAMIKTKPLTQRELLGQKQIKQSIIMLPESGGVFGLHCQPLNTTFGLGISVESR